MNIKKINQLVLKDFLSWSSQIEVKNYRDKIAVVDRGIRVFLVGDAEFPFDIEKVKGDKPLDLISAFKDENASKNGERTAERIIRGTRILQKIANNDTTVWVDEALLKEFSTECTFGITARLHPVYIYEKDALVGLVFPRNDTSFGWEYTMKCKECEHEKNNKKIIT